MKGIKMNILSILAGANNMSAESQAKLFRILKKHKKWSDLASMCLIQNLDTEVDASLKAVNSVHVRESWVNRPGRTTDEILSVLPGEKRVAVINVLLQKELPESVAMRFVKDTSSAKVLLTAMKSATVSEATKELAIRKLTVVETSLNWEQRSPFLRYLKNEERYAKAAMEVCETATLMRGLLHITTITPAGLKNLTKVLEENAKDVLEVVTLVEDSLPITDPDKYRPNKWLSRSAEELTIIFANIASADWTTPKIEKIRENFSTNITRVLNLVVKDKQSSHWEIDDANRLLVHLKNLDQAPNLQKLSVLRTQAKNAEDKDVVFITEELKSYPIETSMAIATTLLHNPKLSYFGQVKVVLSISWEVTGVLIGSIKTEGVTSLPINTLAAVISCSAWELSPTSAHYTAPDKNSPEAIKFYQKAIRLVVDNFNATSEHFPEIENEMAPTMSRYSNMHLHLLENGNLTIEQVMKFSVSSINQAIKRSKTLLSESAAAGVKTDNENSIIALAVMNLLSRVIEAELGDSTLLVWEQFYSLSQNFAGPLASLLDICKASNK